MSKFNRMGDWFNPGKGPFGWEPNSDGDETESSRSGDRDEGTSEDFEFNLSFPQPPDKVWQSMKLMNGRLVVTFEFVFEDPEILETDED
ncbi:MAG TPA: hypothetical protein VF234_05240 [Limnochordia bacterium]